MPKPSTPKDTKSLTTSTPVFQENIARKKGKKGSLPGMNKEETRAREKIEKILHTNEAMKVRQNCG